MDVRNDDLDEDYVVVDVAATHAALVIIIMMTRLAGLSCLTQRQTRSVSFVVELVCVGSFSKHVISILLILK